MRRRSRLIAALLSFMFGTFGVHKFYLKDFGGGIFYLFLFFIATRIGFPITAFLGILDAVRLLMMTDEQFDRKYNTSRYPQRRRTPGRRRVVRQERAEQPQRDRYVLKKNVKRVRENPFKKTGVRRFKDYDLDGAANDLQKALEISPDDKEIHFTLACTYSLAEKKDLSFIHLEKAVENGFKDKDKIMSADELAYLRIQPEFEAFAAKGFKRTESKQIEAPKQENLLEDDVLLSQLNKLVELRKKGLLSEQEFELERKKLMRK